LWAAIGPRTNNVKTDIRSVVSGFDRDGRTILYMYPSRQNTKDSPRQIRHTVYFL
jgi:hypothetical protein